MSSDGKYLLQVLTLGLTGLCVGALLAFWLYRDIVVRPSDLPVRWALHVPSVEILCGRAASRTVLVGDREVTLQGARQVVAVIDGERFALRPYEAEYYEPLFDEYAPYPDFSAALLEKALDLCRNSGDLFRFFETMYNRVYEWQYGDAWPLTVAGGSVHCRQGARFFDPAGDLEHRTYQLNGLARREHHPIDPIWRWHPSGDGRRISISPLIEQAGLFC